MAKKTTNGSAPAESITNTWLIQLIRSIPKPDEPQSLEQVVVQLPVSIISILKLLLMEHDVNTYHNTDTAAACRLLAGIFVQLEIIGEWEGR